MKPRKIIFECHVGSKLYGTDRPDSDDDFMGIFLPSTEDMFSLGNSPSEWSKDEKNSGGPRNKNGDVDRKYYSLQKYLNLLAQGQPKQLEMLFAPNDKILISTPEWDLIKSNKDLFLSKNSIEPFVGFAKAQAYKSSLKGNNLKLVRNIIKVLEDTQALKGYNQLTIEDIIIHNLTEDKWTFFQNEVIVEEVEYRPGVTMKCMVVAGRKFEFNLLLKNVLNKLKNLEEKYGTRSEKALEAGYDFKSLMHCYRLLIETEELLKTGKLSFPVSKENRNFLLSIRNGEYITDYFEEIENKLTDIRKIDSVLPDKINYGKINKLCQKMLMEYYFE